MKNVVFIGLGILLSVLVSCQNKVSVPDGCGTITVDLDRTDAVQKDAAFSNYSYVWLEVTDESLLGDVAKVVCDDERIYVLSMLDPTLFIFDKSGKFQSKLAKGQGPGEVIFVSDIVLYQDTLFVLDNYRSIKAYDREGHYLGEKMRLKDPYFSIHFTPEGLYLMEPNINDRSEHNLHVLTVRGEEKTYLPKNKWLKDVSITTYFTMDGRYVTWPLSDRIYQIEGGTGEVRPIYRIDFKGKWIAEQEYKEAVQSCDMYEGKMDKYAYWLKDVAAIPGGIFFSFIYGNPYYVKYRNGESLLYDRLLEDFPNMERGAVGSDEDQLIYVYSPDELQGYRKEHPQSKLASLEWLECATENLNPVLFFIPLGQ